MQNRPMTLLDLTQDLLWPRLLRLPALALAPGRIFVSLIAIAMIALAFRVPGIWGDASWQRDFTERHQAAQDNLAATSTSPLFPTIWLERGSVYFFETPMKLMHEHPWSAIVSFLLALFVTAILGGAIARSAALETANGVRPSMRSSLSFALGRWSSLAGALLAPLFLVLGIGLALAILGWAALGIPWIKVAGAAAYPVALIGGLLIVLLLLGYALGWPLLGGAVASEGSDGLDAVVRVYAYIQSRPLRLLSYLIIAFAILTLSVGIMQFVVDRTIQITAELSGSWLSDRSASVLRAEPGLNASASDKAAARVIGVWTNIFSLLVAAYTFSFISSAGSVIYLMMRRVSDGQDVGEVWEPERSA